MKASAKPKKQSFRSSRTWTPEEVFIKHPLNY